MLTIASCTARKIAVSSSDGRRVSSSSSQRTATEGELPLGEPLDRGREAEVVEHRRAQVDDQAVQLVVHPVDQPAHVLEPPVRLAVDLRRARRERHVDADAQGRERLARLVVQLARDALPLVFLRRDHLAQQLLSHALAFLERRRWRSPAGACARRRAARARRSIARWSRSSASAPSASPRARSPAARLRRPPRAAGRAAIGRSSLPPAMRSAAAVSVTSGCRTLRAMPHPSSIVTAASAGASHIDRLRNASIGAIGSPSRLDQAQRPRRIRHARPVVSSDAAAGRVARRRRHEQVTARIE